MCLSLNAAKIAGLCGKLMCCIGYENSLYEEIRARIPLTGDIVDTPIAKECKVINVDILAEMCTVVDKEEKIRIIISYYREIEKWYESFLQTEDAKKCVEKFDELLPSYRWFSDVKKNDFFLWSIR